MPAKKNNSADKAKTPPRIGAIILFALLCTTAHADEQLFAAAEAAAEKGELQEMQRLHERILESDPNNIRAMSGKAASLAWQERFVESQQVYRQILALDPENDDARVGLGYAYGWSGEHSKAREEFTRVTARDSKNISAQKGIALTYFWSGDYDAAATALESVARIAPNDAEIWEISGYSHLRRQQNLSAIASFDQSLSIDPDRSAVRAARLDAFRAAPMLDLFVQAGATSDADTGLRRVNISHWLSHNTRLFARFDNTLGLDNPSISNRGEDALGYFAGASHRFNERFTTELEAGVRQLGDGDLKNIGIKSVINSPIGVVTLGTQFGRHDLGHDDILAFGGVNFPIGDRWRLEPAVYWSESGVEADREWRAVLNAERHFGERLIVGAFAGSGHVETNRPASTGKTAAYSAWFRLEFDGPYAFSLALRREDTPARDYAVLELGFNYRLPGNRGGSR